MRDLPRIVADTPVGKDVEVIIVRKGKEETKTVKLGRLDDAEKQAGFGQVAAPEDKSVVQKTLGLELAGITDDLRKKYNIKDTVKGVVITEVDTELGRRRQAARFRASVIVAVEQEQVAAPADVVQAGRRAQEGRQKTALLLVATAEGDMLFVALPIN